MTWYPQDPVEKANHFLKDRHDPQHQLKDQMYPHHGLKHASEAHNPVSKDEGQRYQARGPELYAGETRIQSEFVTVKEKTGFDTLRASQPEKFQVEPIKTTKEQTDLYLHQFDELIKIP